MTQQLPILSLKKIYSGKVRDLYEIDDKRMLMVASDRLSAFDVILDDPIPRKGEILTQISNFGLINLLTLCPIISLATAFMMCYQKKKRI